MNSCSDFYGRIKIFVYTFVIHLYFPLIFERAKGEFNTKLRIAGSNKNRIAKEFPTEKRFSKELMILSVGKK